MSQEHIKYGHYRGGNVSGRIVNKIEEFLNNYYAQNHISR